MVVESRATPAPTAGVRRRRTTIALELLAIWLTLAACGRVRSSAESSKAAPRFGLAHVDLMDLHVERRAEGGVAPREVLSPADLAARYAIAGDSGAGWNRWSLYWDMVQPGGSFDWSAADGIVVRDVAAGLHTLPILQGTPPQFATGGSAAAEFPAVGGGVVYRKGSLAAEVAPQSAPPRELYAPAFVTVAGEPTDDPARAAGTNPANTWAVFVSAAAERYRPGGALAAAQGWPASVGVRVWEIGNEPNLRHFWSGSAEDFARYLEVAYTVIKWRDPGATVLHGGIADDAGAAAWYRTFLTALRRRGDATGRGPAAGYYFDAAAWHWYAYPRLLTSGPANARALVAEAGLPPKPIWVTEVGVPVWSEYPGPCWDPHSPWRATAAEQAGFVWQAAAEAIAAGVEQLTFFQLYDDCGNGPTSYDAFGFVRNQAGNQCWTPPDGRDCWRYEPALAGTPRPAYVALRTAAAVLGEAELLWRPGAADGWERILFYLPPDRRVTAAWNQRTGDRDVQVSATGPQGELHALDAAGASSVVNLTATAGQYAIRLPGATNRNNPGNQSPLMAGRPILLVERDTVAPFRAELAGPDLLPEGARLTVTAADGGTGVDAVQLLVADAPLRDAGAWRASGGPVAWSGPPLAGAMAVTLAAEPGAHWAVGVQVRDRAGNWTAPPAAAQVVVRFGGTAATATPFVVRHRGYLPAVFRSYDLPGHDGPPPTDTPVPSSATATRAPASATVPRTTVTPTSGQTRTPTGTPPPSPTPALGSPSPTTVACVPVGVAVRGPRNEPIRDPSARWTLRVTRNGGAIETSTHALDAQGCAAADAVRREAYVQAAGYVVYPPQDLDASTTLHLSVAPNGVSNGTFEGDLQGWSRFGTVPPATVTDGVLSGRRSALLAPAAGTEAYLAQAVAIPSGGGTLSFATRGAACGEPSCAGAGLEVAVAELDPAAPPVRISPAGGIPADGAWQHVWYDLDLWAGRRVAVTFRLTRPSAAGEHRTWLDNIAVGAHEPPAVQSLPAR